MRVTHFLLFEGMPQDAMDFYVSLFPDAQITSVTR